MDCNCPVHKPSQHQSSFHSPCHRNNPIPSPTDMSTTFLYRTMKKSIYTVQVDNYLPELCALTIPAMERYAKKIKADFHVITERKFPNLPPTYEKTQVWELGYGKEWNILFDCDMAIREEMYDVTQVLPEDSIGSWMVYNPSITIAYDDVLPLDGTAIAIATNFMVVPKQFHDVWKPLTMNDQSIIAHMKRPFVVDEYCMSRNAYQLGCRIAQVAMPGASDNLFMHANITTDGKDVESVVKEVHSFLS